MTAEEATKVGEIAIECPVCARDLIERLKEAFPDHGAIFDDLYERDYG